MSPLEALAHDSTPPPQKGESCLSSEKIGSLLSVMPSWSTVEESGRTWLCKSFKFRNYKQALAFTNKVAAIAEEAEHHPRLTLEWGKLKVAWHTFDVGGLHQIDFILAARSELAYSDQ